MTWQLLALRYRLCGSGRLLLRLGALRAALRRGQQRPVSTGTPGQGVSILKPIYGWDDRLAAAIESHARQEYSGEFELLLGVRPNDTQAIEEIRKKQRWFTGYPIHIVEVTTVMPNGKAGALYDLAAAAGIPSW